MPLVVCDVPSIERAFGLEALRQARDVAAVLVQRDALLLRRSQSALRFSWREMGKAQAMSDDRTRVKCGWCSGSGRDRDETIIVCRVCQGRGVLARYFFDREAYERHQRNFERQKNLDLILWTVGALALLAFTIWFLRL